MSPKHVMAIWHAPPSPACSTQCASEKVARGALGLLGAPGTAPWAICLPMRQQLCQDTCRYSYSLPFMVDSRLCA
eukprot:2790313-Amphidinium_carterae.1